MPTVAVYFSTPIFINRNPPKKYKHNTICLVVAVGDAYWKKWSYSIEWQYLVQKSDIS
jgi:hypothetical protein